MNWDEYARWGKEISDWGSDYHKTLRDRPVRAQVAPGDIGTFVTVNSRTGRGYGRYNGGF